MIYLEGDPGLGKTALARQTYMKHRRYKNDLIKARVYWQHKDNKEIVLAKPGSAMKGFEEIDNLHIEGGFTHFVAYVAPERDVMDWGLPFPSEDRKTVSMLPLEDFAYGPDDRPFIILDELDKAVQMMQNVLGRIMHEKRVGNVILPDTTFVMAAGNPMASKSGSLVSNSHIKNRRTRVPVMVDATEWIEDIALPWDLHSSVISFIRTDHNILHKLDTNKPSYPSPRSWTKVALTVAQNPGPEPVKDGDVRYIEEALIAGEVGEDAHNSFKGHLVIYRQLRPIEEIVAAPDRVALPTGPHAVAQTWAEVTALARHATPKTVDAVCRYFKRLNPDFGFIGFRDMMARDAKMVYASPAGLEWATENGDMLIATAGS